VRDVTARMTRALRALNVQVHEQPPSLPEVATRSSLIVHHGGIGTIEAFLALGRPQLLLPRHFEQSLNAANLLRLGSAMRLRQGFSLADGAALVSEAISSKPMAERASDIAARLTRRPNKSLERIIVLCDELAKF
jgi:rhamnosyltransferase subunit B